MLQAKMTHHDTDLQPDGGKLGMPIATDKANFVYDLLYSYMTMSTYTRSEVNSTSLSHKEGCRQAQYASSPKVKPSSHRRGCETAHKLVH